MKPRPEEFNPVLPFMFLNLAMTADGKIATADRGLSSFGSSRDQEHLLELRAEADAVMAGARTVDSAPVTLGPGGSRFQAKRVKAGRAEFNTRIVVSGTGRLNPEAKIFQERFSPVIVLVTSRAGKQNLDRLRAVADEVRICGDSEIDWRETLAWLRRERGVGRLLCEGGATLNDALFQAGVVNEVHLTVCPLVFGGRQAPTIVEGRGAGSLARGTRLELASRKAAGTELFAVYKVISRRAGP